MIIKVWNNHDYGVYAITPNLQKFYKKEVEHLFTREERKLLKEIAKEFSEMLSLEFAHNLKKGWENKILKNGLVIRKTGEELKTNEEIKKALGTDGQIQFFHKKKNNSCSFIKKIRKPAHLRWN